MTNQWHGRSVISVDGLTKEDLMGLFEVANEMKTLVETSGGNDMLKGRVMAALFYEPSSRTFASFVSAMERLGGGVIPLQGMANSSTAKGETLEDTAQVFSSYADVIVMRNPETGSAATLAHHAWVPVINAGDGLGEHPTQAMLDAYTIQSELGSIEHKHVVFVGELAHYRAVNSLARVLALFAGIKISFVSAPEFALQDEVRTFLKDNHVDFSEYENLDDVIADADALYVTRPKKEFISEELYQLALDKYVVDAATLSKMKQTSIVMHPLPRLGEITREVDADPRAVYLTKQMKNGLYVRMALLSLMLGQ
jgi:aspartate carbamoyltransferase